MDEEARSKLALQEVIWDGSGGRNEKGYDGFGLSSDINPNPQ